MYITFLTLLTLFYEITCDEAPKVPNCITQDKGNCQRCEKEYFLFQLPEDHIDLNLKAGANFCVECPYKKFNEDNNYYCGDCLDNSQTWDKSRICSYDYKTKSTSVNSAFHKIERPLKQLFYVIKSGSQNFITEACDGCDHFCKSQNSTCFPVQKKYSYDLNKLYISCAEEYQYSDAIGGCDSCPDNCKSCLIVTNIKTDSGKTVIETKKECLICNKGFSMLTTRNAIDQKETTSTCVACFSGCETCYFGFNQMNLNTKPWDSFNNKPELLTKRFEANENLFFEDLFKLTRIAQRCEDCTSTAQSTSIPSLNRKTCVRCGTNCKRCEYTNNLEFPTRDKEKVVEPENTEATASDIEALELLYLLKCRQCQKYSQIFQPDGVGCADCSIANCKLCTYFDQTDMATISNNMKFPAKMSDSQMKCALCEDKFYLSEDKTQCTQIDSSNNSNVDCLTYQKVPPDGKKCLQCNIGYMLYYNQNTWQCTLDFSSKDNYLCQSFVKTQKDGKEPVIRCQRCIDGYYVDMEEGNCKPCSQNGKCKTCYTISLKSIHYPQYWDYEFDEDDEIIGPICEECFPPDLNRGPIKNDDLGQCEMGGDNCKIFSAVGLKGYCDECNFDDTQKSRSASSDGYDCIMCPEDTIGCRERTKEEKDRENPYYDPILPIYDKYSTQSFKCADKFFLDTITGRCIKQDTACPQCINDSVEIVIKADCKQLQTVNVLNINSKFNNITSKTAEIVLEDYYLIDGNKLDIIDWNTNAIRKITIILEFQYNKDNSNYDCEFKKDTYFTTNFRKNIFSAKEVELKIKTTSPYKNERLKWYIQKSIYFVYFTSVSLNGIDLYQASDLPKTSSDQYRPEEPFGLQFLNNTGSKFYLENVKIGNTLAEDHYVSKDYTTPYSEKSITLKKQKPFFTSLLNTYEINFKDVVIQSQNYLLSEEITFQAKPFGLVYDSNVILPYLIINLKNVTFSDIAVESQALFEIQPANFSSQPLWNNKIVLEQVQFVKCYFVNNGAFLSTNTFNQPMGIINIHNLTLRNTEYNNSRGIVDFSTMQQIKVNNFQMQDSKVNSTALFHITTIELSAVYLHNTLFNNSGRLIQTQYQLKTIKLNDPNFSGLKMQFTNLEIDQVICLTPACLILITEIQNDYDIPINITMKGLIIKQISTKGFDETILEAATSASIRVEKSNTLMVSDFNSVQNADLTIFYVEQVWTTKFININCNQKEGLKIRNNYCLFINNPYKEVKLFNIQLINLIGRDNSFVGISSWSNLVYNTSTPDYQETIIINGAEVTQCTIVTTALAVPSSAILIDSTQMQVVQISFMNFFNNHHLMEIDGSLRPSNPTFLMRSLVGTLLLSNSTWKSNSVQGFGAVLYLEVGTQIISNIQMNNSNFDQLSQSSVPSINEITEGGHIYISAFNLNMSNCIFSNSTSKLGGAMFLRTLKEGTVILKNVSIRYAYTPLNGAVSSSGGCLYIDSMASQLDMKIQSSEFSHCFTRGEGGGIYLMSYDKRQQFMIEDSELNNCYALSGLAVKTVFYSRTQTEQRMILQQVKISGNQTSSLAYFQQLGSLQQIEMFLFIKRIAAVEQDYGSIEIYRCESEGLYYYGFISIWQANFIILNNIQSQHGVLSFRPYIEILEPQINPIQADTVQFRNISSISIANLNCSNITNNGLCILLQIRLEFSEFRINPALMLFDLIQETTPLKLQNVAIINVICKECHGGFVQIMRVSNSKLIPLVELISCRCSNSESSYYGCFSISSEQYFRQQVQMDSLINVTLNSNLTAYKIAEYANFNQSSKRILKEETINQTQNNYSFTYVIPNPPYLSNVIVKLLNIYDVKAVHGGGISFYGLTVNASETYCTLAVVTGRGGCFYFESYPKNGSQIKQQLNIEDSFYYKNNASIGGAIAMVESGINNYELMSVSFLQCYAKLFGNDVAQYPTQMGIRVNNQIQKQANLDSRTSWIFYPIIIRSGQKMSEFENQTIVVVFLDRNNHFMGYQYNQYCSLSALYDKTQGEILQPLSGNTNRSFIQNSTQGFDYSDQIINYDPYNNITLDAVFSSNHVNIPIYHNQYPYQCIGFDTQYALQVRIRSVECQIGEKYDNISGTCTPCNVGTYSLIYKDPVCKVIDYYSMNYTYMNRIKVQEQFWRPNYETDNIEKCINQVENCKGGFYVGNDMCQIGQIGALCEECDIYAIHWEESYYNSAKFECKRCSERTNNKSVIVITCIIIILTTFLTIYGHEDRIKNHFRLQILNSFSINYFRGHSNKSAILIKIFMNFFQLISLIEGQRQVISQSSKDIINTIAMPAFTFDNALDCLLVEEIVPDIIYLRLIWSLTLTLICYVAMIIIIEILIFKKFLKKKQKYIKTMLIYMFLYFQPVYLIEFLNLIIRRDISDDSYIQANVSFKYYSNNHSIMLKWFIYPGFFLLLFLPLLLLGKLSKDFYLGKLPKNKYQLLWGYIYIEYIQINKEIKFYWEFIKIYIRAGICLLYCLLAQEVLYMGLSSLLLVLFYVSLSYYFQPYYNRKLNKFDQGSFIMLTISYVITTAVKSNPESEAVQLTFSGQFIINAFMILFFIVFIFMIIEENSRIINPCRNSINQRFPWLIESRNIFNCCCWNYFSRYNLIILMLKNTDKANARSAVLWKQVSEAVQEAIQVWRLDRSQKLKIKVWHNENLVPQDEYN
ncbi:unnamed protein product (macronuclear) [Paramecium tetraurelia]|uniref:Uncharacterized protein n=1 Tax=Paramecium tetraurelia TaxID=5888 RepID=A0E4C3_PARTE|nr:uncharacterized protein GSPATT00023314001 [Paramecium tetraurelia]CAK90140.1 unnamed protein product [Paramecium tetraurelia]|eukprot:XP_001457537.1 hypothetical protein (macronuclear) [Paramecium tetraurelia strain d4-2]